ncbi:hypothetical protein pqer_cds_125 [Pandoravirus quercus]|uniref:Uncharacterized protein n=1 Tax=Pandoravirus quercus TaxID=2107709 RepID=A0A2U7U803_9VIRU|nr:hypothetical protein pqer_cds_125 [Pandoravirus quercus]AVK74547.1 hypothetical protein pqer_cds_125 [Pandoravirus quercus]
MQSGLLVSKSNTMSLLFLVAALAASVAVFVVHWTVVLFIIAYFPPLYSVPLCIAWVALASFASKQTGETNADCKSDAPTVRATMSNEDAAWKLATAALDVAATFSSDGGVKAAKAIINAARDVAPGADLHLYVVDCADPARSSDRQSDVDVMTLDMMRRRWPLLFKHGGPRAAEGANVWSLILGQPVVTGRVVVHRLLVAQAALDAEFGPQEDPVVARVRALVAPS